MSYAADTAVTAIGNTWNEGSEKTIIYLPQAY